MKPDMLVLSEALLLYFTFLLLLSFLSATKKKMIDTNEHFIMKCYKITPLCSSYFPPTFVQWNVKNLH